MLTLGIETSCDETALALLETRSNNGVFEYRVIVSLVHSQAELHSKYGGVYPNLAKREHGKNIIPLLKALLEESRSSLSFSKVDEVKFKLDLEIIDGELSKKNPDLADSLKANTDLLKNIPNIDKIAVTEGPGLEPALWVGITFGQILSKMWSKPIIPVNHMEGHIVGSLLSQNETVGQWQRLKPVTYPAIALLISGGHTEIVEVNADKSGSFSYKVLGQTKDDAVGEAFDKVARLLELPYPGGPEVSRLAEEPITPSSPLASSGLRRASNNQTPLLRPSQARGYEGQAITKLPRPMMKSGDLDFSFSGLKTAVLYTVKDYLKEHQTLDMDFKRAIAREFEQSVKEVMVTKLKLAIEKTGAKTIIIGGGVSANKTLKKAFEEIASEYNIDIYLPNKHISGDNALMIALAGALDNKEYNRDLKAHGTKRL